ASAAPPAMPTLEVPATPAGDAMVEDAMADWSPAQALAPQAEPQALPALPAAAQEPASAPEAPPSWSIEEPAPTPSPDAPSTGPADQPTMEISPPPASGAPELAGATAPETETPQIEVPQVEIPPAADPLEEVSWAEAPALDAPVATSADLAEAEAAPALDMAPPAVVGATLWDELGPTPDAVASEGDGEEPVAWWDEIDEAEPLDPSSALIFGRFALAGVASEGGQQAICGVTFSKPIEEAPDASQIYLAVSGAENCSAQVVEVMDKPGFEPSKEGLTVIAESSDGGPFMVSGIYHVD
ncbi:MAG: hypothetical protein ACR2N6_00800, partial [Miltoncostaeaceae bacterium]